MRANAAVVASKVGGIPEIVVEGETGFLVDYDSGDPEAFATNLATKIKLVLDDAALARKMGVKPEKMFELIQASMIRSGVAEYKQPFILNQDYSPNFPLRLMHKDIHLALEAAKEARVKLPALETVEEIYEVASEDGYQDLDYAATLTLLEKWAGVEVKGVMA